MLDKQELKAATIKHLFDVVNKAITIANEAIESAKESRNSDTKSSAGDKYETGREMMQIEIDKNIVQLKKAEILKEELSRIQPQKKSTNALFGSLIFTNRGIYFLSIGHGKIMINGVCVYAISIASPIGNLLHNKKIGDTFEFQTNRYTIEDIE